MSDKREEAMKFLGSVRGQFIVGQALTLAAQQLKESEPSNAGDMKYLAENLFQLGMAATLTVQQNE
jgi:hypothetical protein